MFAEQMQMNYPEFTWRAEADLCRSLAVSLLSIGDETADDRAGRGHQGIIKPQLLLLRGQQSPGTGIGELSRGAQRYQSDATESKHPAPDTSLGASQKQYK